MKNNSIVMIALFSIIIHASISGSEKSSVITSAPTIGRMITHQIYGPVLSNIQNVQKLDRRPLLIAVDYNSILGDDSHRFDGANPHRNLHFRARENILTSSRMSGPHVEIAKKTPPKKSTLVTIEQVQKNFARYNQTSKENMQPQPTELRPQSSQQSMITSLPSSSKNIISGSRAIALAVSTVENAAQLYIGANPPK